MSVLVTTYNHARWVEEALDSLLAQTTDDFEVIIIDDASPDGTADVIQDWLDRTGFPASVVRNPRNRGICANRNTALAEAIGEHICTLSGDDAYEPERIARQSAFLRDQPSMVAGVFSDMRQVDVDGADLNRSFLTRTLNGRPIPESKDLHRWLLLEGNFLPAPATMVRRCALDAVGPYDESLSFEDYDMWLRLSHQFEIRYLPGELVRYRKHDSSLSRDVAQRRDRLDSTARLMAKWVRMQANGEDEAALADRIWAIGRDQLSEGFVSDATRTLAVAGQASSSCRRRTIARGIGLPGGVTLGTTTAGAGRRLKRLWRSMSNRIS